MATAINPTEVVLPELMNNNRGKEVDRVEEERERAEIREGAGLTYKQLCETVAAGIKAETVLVNKDTKKEVGRVPNHTVRSKFAPLAAELIPGAKAEERVASRFPNIVIICADGKRI